MHASWVEMKRSFGLKSDEALASRLTNTTMQMTQIGENLHN